MLFAFLLFVWFHIFSIMHIDIYVCVLSVRACVRACVCACMRECVAEKIAHLPHYKTVG